MNQGTNDRSGSKQHTGLEHDYRIFTAAEARLLGSDVHDASYVWVRVSTAIMIRDVDGLKAVQAEYKAMFSALKDLPEGSRVDIICSTLLARQLNGTRVVKGRSLRAWRDQVLGLVTERGLKVYISWVERDDNVACQILQSDYE